MRKKDAQEALLLAALTIGTVCGVWLVVLVLLTAV